MIKALHLLSKNRTARRQSRHRSPFRLRAQRLEPRRLLAAGDLDLTFGGGDGIVTTAIGSSYDEGHSVTVDAAGNYVVAGYASIGSTFDFALTRYTPAGVLDTSFGGGDGIVTTDIGSSSENGYSVAVDASSNYVVAGRTYNGTTYDFALSRYTSAGVLDASFGGGDGIVTTDIASSYNIGWSVAVDAAGNYVVAGYTLNGLGSDFEVAVTRYTSAGVLDTSFGGGDGIVTTDIGSSNDYGHSVVVDATGNYVVAGHTWNGSNNDFALVRYTSAGVLDASFGGGDGIVTTPNGIGYSVAVDAYGDYIVAGYANIGLNNDFALMRYTSDGVLDTSFGGGDGIVTTDINSQHDYGHSVAVDASGNYVVAGQTGNGSEYDFALVRYEGDPVSTLSATLAAGNLTIADIDASGKNNDLTVKLVNSGADLEITAANESFETAPTGGTLTNGNKTLTIPLSLVTGSLTVNSAGGDDTLTVDFSGGGIGRSINYGGGTDVDSLQLVGGQTTSVEHSFTNPSDGIVDLSGPLAGQIHYVDLEMLEDTLQAADRTFTFTGGSRIDRIDGRQR